MRIPSSPWRSAPDGKKIVTVSKDKTARVCNTDGSGAPLVLRGHEGAIWSVAFSPDGKKLVTGSNDKTARVWNADGSDAPLVLRHEGVVWFSWGFSPGWKKDRHRFGEQDCARLERGRRRCAARSPRTRGSSLVSGVQPGRERRIVTGSEDKTARVWNVDGSGVPLVLPHDEFVVSVAYRPDGKRIVTGFNG